MAARNERAFITHTATMKAQANTMHHTLTGGRCSGAAALKGPKGAREPFAGTGIFASWKVFYSFMPVLQEESMHSPF